MRNFAEWFVTFFETLLKNLGEIFGGFFTGLYTLLIGNPIKYYQSFIESSRNFSALDWVLAIFFILIFVILIIVIVILIVHLIKRYFKFTKNEHDKRELLYQNNLLERKLRNIGFQTQNKNVLSNTNGKISQPINGEDDTKRFTKL